jgi:hypothetical protein
MRILKDSLAIYCQENQDDWDEHLRGVTMAYNTTVNTQTGYTPFYMMYGREAILPNESWMTKYGQLTSINDYVRNLSKALTYAWEKAAFNKPKEYTRMLESQRPKSHLVFHEYEVGDLVMIANVPKQNIKGWLDSQYRAISAKLQPRFSGPYPIVTCKSPVVYGIQVDGREKYIHAVNMKPFKGQRLYETPEVQRGYEPHEASQLVPPTPLLLSPDPDLNERARTKFLNKNMGPQREQTRKAKKQQGRQERERTTRESQSSSSQHSQLLKEYEDTIQHQDYEEWREEKARRRIELMKFEKESFNKLPKSVQDTQLIMMDQLGFTFEDIIEMELDRQEKDWRKSLREIQPYQRVEPVEDSDVDNSDDNQEDDEKERQPRSYKRC